MCSFIEHIVGMVVICGNPRVDDENYSEKQQQRKKGAKKQPLCNLNSVQRQTVKIMRLKTILASKWWVQKWEQEED
jgi:hypothetical protein